MSLLSLEGVSKRYTRGSREFVALRDVWMSLEPRELAVVLGTRKSGRSTLLRLAAGLERPDEGMVRLRGVDLAREPRALGRAIAFCHLSFSSMHGESVLDHVAAPLIAQHVSLREARRTAERALDEASVLQCAGMTPDDLDGAELTRVAIARALAVDPDLIVVDDPTARAGVLQGEGILRLLRGFSQKRATVLMSTDDASCIAGADRVLSLDNGELRSEVEAPLADVLPLSTRRIGAEPGARLG